MKHEPYLRSDALYMGEDARIEATCIVHLLDDLNFFVKYN